MNYTFFGYELSKREVVLLNILAFVIGLAIGSSVAIN
jgi:hypothetical protein